MEAQAAGNVREELQELDQEVREKSKAADHALGRGPCSMRQTCS